MHTKSTLLTTCTIADMRDAEKEFAMVRHKVTKFDFLPLSCKCHGKEKANSFVVVVATEIQERDTTVSNDLSNNKVFNASLSENLI